MLEQYALPGRRHPVESQPMDAGSDWQHWRRVVEIPTRLPAEEVYARLTRLFAEGRISGVRNAAMEGSDRFRIGFYGGQFQPDIVIQGRIQTGPDHGLVVLAFHGATPLKIGLVVLAVLAALQLALGDLTPAQAAFGVLALGVLFALLAHVVGPRIVTRRVTAWIQKALE
jgi:hypothetical protein